jgi:1-phosphatidylinositol-3-phosphate 5-kinase
VKDAIQDESESSDSSSEADDEGGDDEDTKSSTKVSPEVAGTLSAHDAGDEPKGKTPAQFSELDVPPSSAERLPTESPLQSRRDTLASRPSSPYLPYTADTKVPTPTPSCDIELGPPGQERNSLFRALSGFWPQNMPHRNRADDETDDPRYDPEHIFRDSSMVVRTDEPTSIIALALSSQQYRDMLSKSRAEKRQSREPRLTEGGEAFMPDDRSVAGSTSTWGVVNIDPSESGDPTDELRAPSSRLPWAITFESGGLTISCTVLYPEQFDALRRTYDCDKCMIESLARCVKWNASGGKSGSAFLKTLDDRFIAKEMSRTEFQTMESFAPSYFAYMSSAVSANRPTLLAKVLGCYKISFKKLGRDKGSGRWKSTQMNLIVMENLFYDRRFSKIYDLKGSTRNRHVKSTGRENEVLLDENLVQSKSRLSNEDLGSDL